jgi:hypothetical protein
MVSLYNIKEQPCKCDINGTWNVRNLYRSGSVTTVAREFARYKSDLVGVQEGRWDKRGTVRAGDYIFFLWIMQTKIILRSKEAG